jgi:hypothetical protein
LGWLCAVQGQRQKEGCNGDDLPTVYEKNEMYLFRMIREKKHLKK